MADIRFVTQTFAVCPQILPEDVAEAAAAGFTLIINNRPDGEAPGQPTSAIVEAEVRAAGLDYAWIPVVGPPSPEQVADVRAALAASRGRVLAFCRSGTRSINTWALAQARAGATIDDLIEGGRRAGYDLSWLRVPERGAGAGG